jgi:hypothetical protein
MSTITEAVINAHSRRVVRASNLRVIKNDIHDLEAWRYLSLVVGSRHLSVGASQEPRAAHLEETAQYPYTIIKIQNGQAIFQSQSTSSACSFYKRALSSGEPYYFIFSNTEDRSIQIVSPITADRQAWQRLNSSMQLQEYLDWQVSRS